MGASSAGLALIGRVLIAAIFAYFGYLKAMNFDGTTAYFARWGFPLPQVSALLAVVFELGGGILLILGWKTRAVAWLLVLYTVIATAVAHRYWSYPADQAFNQMSHFFKNVSLIGALLYLAAAGPGPLAVDRR
jgi:putative oxidoreductase